MTDLELLVRLVDLAEGQSGHITDAQTDARGDPIVGGSGGTITARACKPSRRRRGVLRAGDTVSSASRAAALQPGR